MQACKQMKKFNMKKGKDISKEEYKKIERDVDRTFVEMDSFRKGTKEFG